MFSCIGTIVLLKELRLNSVYKADSSIHTYIYTFLTLHGHSIMQLNRIGNASDAQSCKHVIFLFLLHIIILLLSMYIPLNFYDLIFNTISHHA